MSYAVFVQHSLFVSAVRGDFRSSERCCEQHEFRVRTTRHDVSRFNRAPVTIRQDRVFSNSSIWMMETNRSERRVSATAGGVRPGQGSRLVNSTGIRAEIVRSSKRPCVFGIFRLPAVKRPRRRRRTACLRRFLKLLQDNFSNAFFHGRTWCVPAGRTFKKY